LFLKQTHSLVFLLDDALDDTNCNGSLHVPDSESTERRVFTEGFDTEWLEGDHSDKGTVTLLDGFGLLFDDGTVSPVDLTDDFFELAGNMSSVAIQCGGITGADLVRVIHDDNLGDEFDSGSRGIILKVTTDITSADLINGDTSAAETNIGTWLSCFELLVMALNGLDFTLSTVRGEDNLGVGLQDTSLDSTTRDGTDTLDLVDVLEWDSEWLIDVALGGNEVVKGLKKSRALEPAEVVGLLDQVLTSPTGNGDELSLLDVETDLLDLGGDLLLNFVVSGL